MRPSRPAALRRASVALLATALVVAVATGAAAAFAAPSPQAAAAPHSTAPLIARTGTSANLPGTTCPVFPADSIWHADVSALPVASQSATWLSNMQASTRKLHPDFGPSGGYPYGIPVTVVTGSHAKVPVTFDYADESDPGPYPLGPDTQIEGGPGAGGDRHAIVVDASTCTLYETWDTQGSGSSWTAGSGAIWNLRSDALRTDGWTSADAAGLPILPGLLRYDEVAAGDVDHAIRFTTNQTSNAYVWPARHQAGSANSALPPMGAWFRLKASYPTTGLSAQTITVINAMKKHGMVLADNGSPWYFQGTADDAWPQTLLDQLKAIPASAFEAVDVSSLRASANSGQAWLGSGLG